MLTRRDTRFWSEGTVTGTGTVADSILNAHAEKNEVANFSIAMTLIKTLWASSHVLHASTLTAPSFSRERGGNGRVEVPEGVGRMSK